MFTRKRRAQKEPFYVKTEKENQDEKVHADLLINITRIKKQLGNSDDLIIREFMIGKSAIHVAIVYMTGLVDEHTVNMIVMRSLMFESVPLQDIQDQENEVDFIKEHILALGNMKVTSSWNDLMLSLLTGYTIIFVSGETEAIIGNTKGGKRRAVAETDTQMVVRGPKEAFTEAIRANISLIRRRIKSPNLWVESFQIGEITQTSVSIMYIKGIASDEIVNDVKQRLEKIKIDGVLESGYIEELIEDRTSTLFPTMFNSERPDLVAGQLLEGRVAILVDGTPFVLIVPTTFIQYFQSPEDYYSRFEIGSFLRILRIVTYWISLLAPSVYISLTTYHHTMIPFPLLISLAAQREGVPYPAFLEALLMELTFEILREAGVRIPRAVGPAISIVGALVLGEAAVQAGLVSPVMVIVVSITAIGSFAVPSYNIQISARLLRFIFMVLAAAFGFYGIMLGLIYMLAHMCSLRSFGVPYLAPFAPFILSDQKDAIFRFPIKMLKTRPKLLSLNQTRSKEYE